MPPEVSALVADKDYYYFQRGDMHYRVEIARWNEIYSKHKAVTEAEHKQVVEAGGG